MSWSVDIVEQDGTKVVQNVDGATVGPIRWVLNRPTTCSVSLPILSLEPDDIVSEDGDTLNEVQVYRDGELVGWFIPVGITENETWVELDLADPLWLLSRRFVGELYDTNLLTNASFEGGTVTDGQNQVPSGWTRYGLDNVGVEYSVNALAPSTVLWIRDSTASTNQYLYQDVALPERTDQSVWMATGYVWVEPLVPFVGTDYQHGLTLARFDGSNVIQDAWWSRLSDSTDKYYWTRQAAPLKVGTTDGTEYLRVWLGCPEGKVYYDAIRLVEVKRLAFLGTDQAIIARTLVEHAQDTAIEKADLDLDTDCEGTGIYVNRVYPYAEHEEILQALIDLAESVDGFDFSMTCTPTSKTFTTHYPSKGSASPVATFEWGVNIAEFSRSTDIAQAAGSVSVLGPGTTDADGRGDDREHYWAADGSSLSGRRLETLEMAPSRANVTELEDMAVELVEARRAPSVLDVKRVERSSEYDWAARIVAGTLQVGDVVTVKIEHGTVSVDAPYRLVELTLDPADESIAPVLEPARTFDS